MPGPHAALVQPDAVKAGAGSHFAAFKPAGTRIHQILRTVMSHSIVVDQAQPIAVAAARSVQDERAARINPRG
jgi:hypothetical protein